MKQQVYAAVCNDEVLRQNSSSGGIFTLLAEAILEKGGVVFGAAVAENLQVRHVPVEKIEDLARLRGSKYVRSHMGDSYRQVKMYLDAGRLVLFSGTPCQIGGLKAYLKKDYVNLVCQDLACHGSPMEWVYESYVNHRECAAGSKAVAINFRDKVTGWEAYSMTIRFENGEVYTQRVDRDPYMKAFLREYTLGKSCYHCAFKGLERQADITLADLWGAAVSCPQLYDGKGTSAVFVHTEKGEALWKEIGARLTAVPITAEAVVESNPALLHSAPEPKNREAFLEALKTEDFEKTVERFCPRPSRLQRLVRRVLGKIKRILTKK